MPSSASVIRPLVLLSLATLFIAAAAAGSYFEPALIKMLRTA
ncbi:hypothetical protein [Methylobacterium tardum]|nr:hypothetical protein [Methylobacterium tardum]